LRRDRPRLKLPVGPAHTVASLSAVTEDEIGSICGRYDARNGTSAVSDRAGARLGREPLADEFPLGLPSRLPPSAAPSGAAPSAAGAGPADLAAAGAGAARRAAASAPAGASLDELTARARELGRRRHPGAGDAWARVAATAAADGRELPGDVAAQVARFSAAGLLHADPAAGRAALLAAAARFAELGDLDGELEARAVAAQVMYVTGDAAGGRAALDAVCGEANAAFAAGKLTPRYYLNVVLVDRVIAGHALDTASERSAADIKGFVSGLESALAVAEQHGDAFQAGRCRELLAHAAFWRGDQEAVAAHFAAARESFLTAATPWAAVEAESNLAELALRAGNPQQAQAYARDALAHAIDPPARQAAMLASLRAEALGQIPDRTAEFADACLTAAARWDGLSEPDTLHNTFNAARAYARLNQHAEAAALYAEAMPKVNVPYDQAGSPRPGSTTRARCARSNGTRKRPSSSSRRPGCSPPTRPTPKGTPSWPPMPRASWTRPGRTPPRSRPSSGRRSCSAASATPWRGYGASGRRPGSSSRWAMTACGRG
jgi:hypothetical protein